MRIFYNKVDKKNIALLPRAVFNGRIIVVQTEAEADKAVAYLRTFPLLGIDTETRPSFKKGKSHKVALLQISNDDTCFLFRLNRFGLVPSLVGLLEDKNVVKVGLSLQDDFALLKKRAEVKPEPVVELQKYIRQFGIEDMSLQKLYANVFGEKISKGQQLTNWEADVLTDGQKLYAATDAWACLNMYKELEKVRLSGDYVLRQVAAPVADAMEVNVGA